MTDETAIVVESLTKKFGDVEALAGVDFQVESGTVFGLLGPTGAGKTTAIRILTTILRPDGGRAEVLGFDVVRDAQKVRLRIGMAGQFAAVDALLTGRENLRLVGKVAQMPRDLIMPGADELLDRFELTDAAEDRKSTRLNSSHVAISYAVFCLKKKKRKTRDEPQGHTR